MFDSLRDYQFISLFPERIGARFPKPMFCGFESHQRDHFGELDCRWPTWLEEVQDTSQHYTVEVAGRATGQVSLRICLTAFHWSGDNPCRCNLKYDRSAC